MPSERSTDLRIKTEDFPVLYKNTPLTNALLKCIKEILDNGSVVSGETVLLISREL